MTSDRESPAARARALLRSIDHATLATAGADGWPYPSLVQVAVDHAGSPLLLLSGLAEHSRNIAGDDRAGLLFDGTWSLNHRLAGARLSVLGRLVPCQDAGLRDRYLRRHPAAAQYAVFADFALYRMVVERAHLVAGFGAIHWISAGDLLLPNVTSALAEAEARIIDHMNEDHADAIALFAAGLAGTAGEAAAGAGSDPGESVLAATDSPAETARTAQTGEGAGWIMTGIDPEGCDLRRGKATVRVPFSGLAQDAGQARQHLVERATYFRALPGSQAIT